MVSNGIILMGWGAVVYLTAMGIVLHLVSAPAAMAILTFGVSTALQYFFGYLARAELRNALFVVSGVGNTVAGAFVSVGLLVKTDLGVEGIFFGLAAGNLLQMAMIARSLRPWKYFKISLWDTDLQKTLLRFSLPLCLASAAYWLLSGFTRLALVHFSGQDANGLFAVADRFGFAITLTSTVVVYVWQELLYIDHGNPNSEQRRDRGLRVLIAGILLVGAASICGVALTFDWVVTADFKGAYVLVPVTISAAVVNTLSNLIGVVFLSQTRTRPILVTTLVGAAFNVALGLALIPRWGALGGAAALLCGFAVIAMLRALYARDQGSLRWVDGRTLIALLVMLGSIAAYLSQIREALWLVIGALLAVLCWNGVQLKRLRLQRPG